MKRFDNKKVKHLETISQHLSDKAFEAYSESDERVYGYNDKYIISHCDDLNIGFVTECNTLQEVNNYFEEMYNKIF